MLDTSPCNWHWPRRDRLSSPSRFVSRSASATACASECDVPVRRLLRRHSRASKANCYPRQRDATPAGRFGARLRRLGFGLEAVALAWNLIWWTAVTACVMFALAWGKHPVGRRLGNPVLVTEGRVTLIDGVLAVAVLAGLLLDLLLGWWWADPVAALVVVFYACREAVHIFRE
jgi:hypothetical protein